MIVGRHYGRATLAASAAVAALLSATAASAQAPVAVDEVVVTAQKREQNVQDVPISISVVDAEGLQARGASSLADYAAFVPGLQVDGLGSPGRAIISLRGITPLASSSTIGIYLDDAPIGSSGLYNRSNVFSFDMMPYDIERLELLRGPQGTLYGASAIGGLLKYVTVEPSLSEFSGRAGGELFAIKHGSDPGYAGNVLVNMPLVDGLVGLTASYSRRSTPGYIDNVLSGEDDINETLQEGARLALLFRPNDRASARLQAIWQKTGSDDSSAFLINETGPTPWDRFETANIRPEPFETEFHYYAATLDYDLGFATATSTTSYSRIKTFERSDASRLYGVLVGGESDFDSYLSTNKWSQELRLTSPASDRFEWLVGGFYTEEDSTHDQYVLVFDPATGAMLPGLNPLAIVGLPTTYKEWALFGNATWKLNEQFHVTGGLRYAENDQTFRQISAGVVVPPANVPGTSKEDVLTFSISPQYHFSPDTMLYARVATGYRPGGPNVALPGVPPAVMSDTLTDYEVGLKSVLQDGRLRLDVAAFYMDWTDIQIGVQFPNGVGGLANAGTARSQGFEGSVVWEPSEGLTLGLNGAYTDAKLTEDTPPSVGGLDGDRLPRVPKWSGSATADYGWEVSDWARAQVGAAVRYTGKRFSAAESSPQAVEIDSYTALDLNASLTLEDRWTLRTYVRNVTDSNGELLRAQSTPNPGFLSITPLQPRTVGVAVDLRF